MKRSVKTILSLVLVLALALTVTGITGLTGVAATAETVKHYDGFTVLGDSLASGFGLDDYNQYGELYLSPRRIEGSYGAIVADAVECGNYYPLAYPAFRTADLRMILDESYNGDWITDQELEVYSDGHYTKKDLIAQRPKFRNAIKNSELVTVEIGLNDLWIPEYAALLYYMDDVPDEYALGDFDQILAYQLKRLGSLEAMMEDAEYLAKKVVKTPLYLATVASAAKKFLTDFHENYRAIMDCIYEINPDITVVAVGMLDGFEGWSIPEEDGIEFMKVLMPIYETMNEYIEGLQDVYGEEQYRYADVMGTPLIGDDVTMPYIVFMSLDDSGYNPHPTPEGQEYMAKQILAVLDEKGPDDDSDKDCPSLKFSDLDTAKWYHEPIDYVLNKGLMEGVSSTKFDPEGTLTRGMAVTMLYALEGKPTTYDSIKFMDVSDSAWYSDAVAWAAKNGIVAGYQDNTFRPKTNITRAQLVTILRQYAKYRDKEVPATGDLSFYSDVDDVPDWYASNISWATAHGIITGRPGNRIAPQETVTRAETATMFKRFSENVLSQ